jgi:hypothetical protein
MNLGFTLVFGGKPIFKYQLILDIAKKKIKKKREVAH